MYSELRVQSEDKAASLKSGVHDHAATCIATHLL